MNIEIIFLQQKIRQFVGNQIIEWKTLSFVHFRNSIPFLPSTFCLSSFLQIIICAMKIEWKYFVKFDAFTCIRYSWRLFELHKSFRLRISHINGIIFITEKSEAWNPKICKCIDDSYHEERWTLMQYKCRTKINLTNLNLFDEEFLHNLWFTMAHFHRNDVIALAKFILAIDAVNAPMWPYHFSVSYHSDYPTVKAY